MNKFSSNGWHIKVGSATLRYCICLINANIPKFCFGQLREFHSFTSNFAHSFNRFMIPETRGNSKETSPKRCAATQDDSMLIFEGIINTF
ncbi:hypothetical protein AB833_08945 [Chromatiales bacterium (ex Bugula neritina AB1)]|nr:hypothetical protein AB833_08945 [Chromatiales bacterium (ex Bugula neritina AB1)]